jgi:serine acetyltransferase
MTEVSKEIIAWSRHSIFSIEDSWLSPMLLDKVLPDFKADYSRYYLETDIDIKKVKYFPGLMGTLLYRISRSYFLSNEENIALEFSSLARFLTGMEIYYSSSVGKGIKINHGAGLVIGARTTIGENCLFHQNVTIGDRRGGRPIIGNNVTIYSGSSVIGEIKIGDNVTIAANTVVLKSIESNKIVIGNPNKVKDAKN